MDDLKKKRSSIKSKFTRILTYCNSPDSDHQGILARAEKSDEYFKSFEAIQDEIEAAASTQEAAAAEESVRTVVEEKYYAIKTIEKRVQQENAMDRTHNNGEQTSQQFNTVMDTLARNQSTLGMLMERMGTNQTSTPNPHPETPTQNSIQLPRIRLPEFDGSITNWIHFRDLFTALIHNRSNLSNIEKFEYLQGHVRGDALSVIKHLGPSNENYTIAWNLIQAKFDNSIEIKRSYLKLLFDQPSMKGPLVTDLKRLLNNTNEGINALNAMNEHVDQWDSVLVFHLEHKLDHESQTLWCRSITTSTTMKQFLQFL